MNNMKVAKVVVVMDLEESRWLYDAINLGTPTDETVLRKRLPFISIMLDPEKSGKDATMHIAFDAHESMRLRALVQNPFRDPEGPLDERLRRKIWDMTSQHLSYDKRHHFVNIGDVNIMSAHSACLICGGTKDVSFYRNEKYGDLDICRSCVNNGQFKAWLENYKGWGVEELADKWGLPYKNDGDDAKVVVEKFILSELEKSKHNIYQIEELADEVRAYCKALAAVYNGDAVIDDPYSFWKTLSETRDDYFLLKMFACVAKHAWT